ncbi:MAG TPA: LTA synthase family protein [Cyclobacteriaceae bacterium]|jgi:phosphoglycerol transferase MdoB-like AlkP superfamily enzyme|nr:LTA synthase family protein [Cyclobacteriaceae bacterium]
MFKKYFSGLRWGGNIYAALALSLLLVMALYSAERVAFYLFNTSYFPEMTLARMGRLMWGGLRFDLSATLYSNSLFILLMILPITFRFHRVYQKAIFWIFITVNAIAFAINTADFIYYRFTLRRTTVSVFSQFKNEDNLGRLSVRFLWDYWYAFLFWLLIVAALYFVFRRIKFSGPQVANKAVFYISGVLALLVSVYLFVGGARGGFRSSTRPITLSNAAAYAQVPNDVNIVLNTPFALMRTAKANVIEKVNYFPSEQELDEVFTPLRTPKDTTSFQPKNVVVLILESFSKEFIGAYNKDLDGGNYKGYTPFLDSLIEVSYAYQYSLANGRKSIDAMPSVISSIPSIEVPYVLSHFSGNKVNSLANLLREQNYYTAFFHGAPNGSMGFDAFANLAGFENYFGKTEYNNDADFDGIWGIWDEPFLQYFAHQMNTFRQPFYTTLFTVSSHHPYHLPEGYENKFKTGPHPVHQTIGYTDYALRRFFKLASSMPWFKNTLFVITADHASAEINVPEYNTAWGYFSIPVFFYQPEEKGGGLKPEIIQQIDIMPTLLGRLHYNKPYVAFGRDIFNDRSRPFAFNYLNNLYQIFRGNYLLQFDGKNVVSLYQFKQDRFLKNNLVDELPDTVQSMSLSLKAFIQQYNNRMVENNLTSEGSQIKKVLKQ